MCTMYFLKKNKSYGISRPILEITIFFQNEHIKNNKISKWAEFIINIKILPAHSPVNSDFWGGRIPGYFHRVFFALVL